MDRKIQFRRPVFKSQIQISNSSLIVLLNINLKKQALTKSKKSKQLKVRKGRWLELQRKIIKKAIRKIKYLIIIQKTAHN